MSDLANRSKIQSGVRMMRIVETLKSSGPIGVTDLSEKIDIPKSTIYVHLSTLRDEGYIFKNDADEYALGLKFLDLGIVARKNRPSMQSTKKKIGEIAEQTGEKVWCIVEEEEKAVFLYEAQGKNAIQTFAYPGKRAELYELAGGRAILANVGSDRRASILEGYEREGHFETTPFTRAELEDVLAEIRDQGYAFNREFYVKHVAAVGVPIMDNRDVVRGALSISGPINRLEGQQLEEDFPELLLGTANEIGVNMSYDQ